MGETQTKEEVLLVTLTREGIGRRLARAREAAGLSQIQVAEYLSVNRESVSYVENGHRPIDLPTLHRLTDLYGVSLSWFLDEDESPDEPVPALVDGIAFRAHDLSARDWETVSWVKRIAMNLDDLNHILDAGGK